MSDLFAEIREEIDSLEMETASKKSELADVQTQTEDAHQNLKIIQGKGQEARAEYEAEAQSLEGEIKSLQTQLDELKGEVKELVEKKAAIQVENTRLAQQNEQFKKYEIIARKTLEVKDQELVQREQNITEKESLHPGTKSFLPSANE